MNNTGIYRALVVSNDDPEGRGRLKVRVPAITGTAIVGWVWPAYTDVDPAAPGQQVFVFFEGGDLDYPIWFGSVVPL